MSEIIKREAVGTIEGTGDGRTLDVRILPYRQEARVSDDGGKTHYTEIWEPGVFDHLKNAANRAEVLANFEHQQGIAGVLARGTELRDSDEALDGTFRMLNHTDADKALELVNEGILRGVSIEAIPKESERVGDVVRRIKATLVGIALCRSPAFPGAGITAVREAPPPEDEPAPEPPPEDAARTSEVDEMLSRVGFEPITAVTVSRKPWNPSPENYEDPGAYARACLIAPHPHGEKDVSRCWLPVYEPSGDLNVHALEAAAKRINHAPASTRPDAARKLLRLYRTAGMEVPSTLRKLAAR